MVERKVSRSTCEVNYERTVRIEFTNFVLDDSGRCCKRKRTNYIKRYKMRESEIRNE